MQMQMTRHVTAAGETHRGGRSTNQDALVVEPHLGLFAVLDGMGGAAAGDIAAQLAGDTLVEFARRHADNGYSRRELLEFGIDYAGTHVHRHAKSRPEYKGMGTTVVACLVSAQNEVVIGHVGDSRAYLVRDGRLHLLTRDHNMAQQLLDAGRTPDEDELKFYGHVLTRNLGDEHGAKADMLEMELHAGDRLLLCSDGLSNCVSAEALHRVLASEGGPAELARTLVDMALSSGTASDNITALVLTCSGAGTGQLEHANTRATE